MGFSFINIIGMIVKANERMTQDFHFTGCHCIDATAEG